MDRYAHEYIEQPEIMPGVSGAYAELRGILTMRYEDLEGPSFKVSGFLKNKLRGE